MKITPKSEMLFPEGTYPARVVSIEESEGRHGPCLLWTFEIEHEGSSYAIDQFTSTTNSATGHLVKWSSAILGDLGAELDTDDLEGKPCRLVLGIEEDKDTGQEKTKIVKVRAPTDKQKSQPAKPAPAKEDEDDEDFDSIPF